MSLLDTHYFAYGTLLGPSAMTAFAPSAELVGQGQVAHRMLVFRRYAQGPGEGGCSIAHVPGEVLQGAIYKVTADEFETMDDRVRRSLRWFDRLPVEVHTSDGETLTVSTYHIPEPLSDFAPSDEYVASIFSGARELDLPGWYVRRLNDIVSDAQEHGKP